MIEATLRTLETHRDQTVCSGLDEQASPVWHQTGEALLLRIGGWQKRIRELGFAPGDRIGVDLPRGPDLLAAHLAVLALGGCVVPLNPALRARERERVLARAELRGMLDSTLPAPEATAPEYRPFRDPTAPALLIFTSGTTGEPKGVPHTLPALEANLAGLAATWGLREAEPLLHVLPAHHVHGLVLALYGSARRGMPILLAPRFDAEACLLALQRHRVAVLMGVPTMYHRLARASRIPALPALRLLVSGSAPLAPGDFDAVQARFGSAPLERYGLTETLIVSSNPLHAERRAGTVGFALPETEIRLAEDGEIEVRGPAVTPGYWRDPGATAAAMHGDFFRTGDLGRLDPAGYLVISGRKKELIIVGGSNVLPGEVEAALAGEPGVDELAAAGVPDPDRGERVALFVVLSGAGEARRVEARLRARAEEALASYKRPSLYVFLAGLPRNAMGKIDRAALRSAAAATAG